MLFKLFALLSLVFISALCGEQRSENTVILEANEAPPFWSQKMPHNGMCGEIVYAISKAGGIDSKIVFRPLSRNIEDDRNNDLGNPAFFIVNEDFAEIIPIALYHVSLYYYAPNQKAPLKFTSIEDLRGKRIGILKGTLIDTRYFQQEGILFEESYTQESLFKKLKIGRLDMVIEIELVSQLVINKLFPEEADSFVKIALSHSSSPIAIMLSEENPDAKSIADAYRKGLKEIITDGTYQQILKKYYKQDIEFDKWLKDMKHFEELYKSGESE